jgi:hypothetical protein
MFQNKYSEKGDYKKKDNEILEEVFRISPELNKAYETAIYTKKIGIYPNVKYYTTNKVIYVGIMIKEVTHNHRDASYGYVLFSKNGIEEKVDYTYEGTTCFREVPIKPCKIPSLFFLTSEVVKKYYNIDELRNNLLLLNKI